MSRQQQPKEWQYIDHGVAEFQGRRFYGDNAHDRAELTYLREWKRWAEAEIRSLTAFWEGVQEALNSGDGSYRP